MKYFNKTRTIEQKQTDRETIELLRESVSINRQILEELRKK